MKQIICFILILTLEQSNELNIDDYSQNVEVLLDNSTLLKDFDDYLNYLLSIDPKYGTGKTLKDLDFNCEPISASPAQSVNKLKPNDIKIVAALGDSITAALGAKSLTLKDVQIEYRGISWSIGGDEDTDAYATLPNILRKYNRDIYGYSVGYYKPEDTKKGVGLNVAVSGQESNDILAQAKTLIKRIKASEDLDWKEDWKLVTLFIGANDLCAFCDNLKKYSPNAYIGNIEKGLDLLEKSLPKTFVNLVTIFDISQMIFTNKSLTCTMLHDYLCPCVSIDQENVLLEFIDKYQNLTEQLVNSGKYDTKDDFTVVIQPMFKDFVIPKLPNGETDVSYFAPDCFHPAAKTHGEIY